MQAADRIVLMQIEQFVSEKLEEFAKSGENGIISIDIPVSDGKPHGINCGVKENRKVTEKRGRFPV